MFFVIQAILALAACVFFFLLQGYRVLGLCCLGLMAVLLFYRLAHKLRQGLVRLVTVLLCLGLAVFAVTEGFIIHGSLGAPQESRNYLIVLGAKVNPHGPSMALRDRINAACDYLTAHPDCTAILSGGQGPDEPMTEAQCMYNELVAMGIAPERIWLEDRAVNTKQNLRYSMALIEEKTGTRPDSVGVLSSDTHLLRAKLLAKRQGIAAITVAAPSAHRSSYLKHFLREIVVVWYYALIGL